MRWSASAKRFDRIRPIQHPNPEARCDPTRHLDHLTSVPLQCPGPWSSWFVRDHVNPVAAASSRPARERWAHPVDLAQTHSPRLVRRSALQKLIMRAEPAVKRPGLVHTFLIGRVVVMPKEYDAEMKAKAVRLVQTIARTMPRRMRRLGPSRAGWG